MKVKDNITEILAKATADYGLNHELQLKLTVDYIQDLVNGTPSLNGDFSEFIEEKIEEYTA